MRLNLKVYSIDDVEGLVGGYNLKIKCKGKIRNVRCSDHISIKDLIKPYLCPSSHQWWMKDATRKKIAKKLKDEKILEKQYGSFEELYDMLLKLKITSGELFRYDLALRISQCLNILPKDYVYLHAGAEMGAKILTDKGLIKLPAKWKHCVGKGIFDNIFPNMESIDIENILCVHKKDFKNL